MYGLYSVIRYVKDVVRDEAKNIGIILVCEDKFYIQYDTSIRPEIASLFEYLKKEKSIDLYQIRHDWQNSIQITEPRVCACEDAERCMQNLYKIFVS